MALSGAELMLKSLGLGPIMEQARALAESGAVQKVLLFAEQVEPINEQLGRIERLLTAIAERLQLLEQHSADGLPGGGGVASGNADNGYVTVNYPIIAAIDSYRGPAKNEHGD